MNRFGLRYGVYRGGELVASFGRLGEAESYRRSRSEWMEYAVRDEWTGEWLTREPAGAGAA